MADKKHDRPSWIRFSGIGIEFAAAVAVFTLIGYWIDQKHDSQPKALLICLVLGLVGGMYNLIRASLAAMRDAERNSSEKEDEKK